MGCIFTKVCEDIGDDDKELPDHRARRLSRAKTTLLSTDSATASLTSSTASGPKKLPKSEDEVEDTIYYGGGIPGIALDTARVELPEFTGAREGGYQSVNGRLRWGSRTRAGNDPLRRRKENQDCFCIADVLADDKNVTFFSVFDGHGPEGAYVSHFVREKYHESLAAAYTALVTRPTGSSSRKASCVSCDVISETFHQAAQNVTEKLTNSSTGMDISVSGTTAVGLLVCDRDVFLANIGDSRAIIAQFCTEEQTYVLHCETKDHKPDVPEERQRIESSNGRVFEWGSYRVWLQDVDMPGLAMSRSFGDSVAKTVGVTSEPDVTIVEKLGKKAEHPSFAVLASDGVWEFMSTDECVEFVSQCILVSKMSPQQTCDALVDEAYDRWNAEEDVVDDITAVVVYF